MGAKDERESEKKFKDDDSMNNDIVASTEHFTASVSRAAVDLTAKIIKKIMVYICIALYKLDKPLEALGSGH